MKTFSAIAFSAFGALAPVAAFAQSSIAGLEFLGIPADASVGDMIAALYIYGVGFVALAAFIMFTYGGVQYIFAGDKDPSGAKENMWNAFWGLVLALTSWIILYTINPKLIQNVGNLNLQTIQTGTSGTSPGQTPTSVPNILIAQIRQDCAATPSHACVSNPNCERPTLAGIPTGDCQIKQSLVVDIQRFCRAQTDESSCGSNVNCTPVLNAAGNFSRCTPK